MPIDPKFFKQLVTNHFENLTEEEFLNTLTESSPHFSSLSENSQISQLEREVGKHEVNVSVKSEEEEKDIKLSGLSIEEASELVRILKQLHIKIPEES
jgi:molybdopterin-biosynthesis enzyme MoeA-like protein